VFELDDTSAELGELGIELGEAAHESAGGTEGEARHLVNIESGRRSIEIEAHGCSRRGSVQITSSRSWLTVNLMLRHSIPSITGREYEMRRIERRDSITPHCNAAKITCSTRA